MSRPPRARYYLGPLCVTVQGLPQAAAAVLAAIWALCRTPRMPIAADSGFDVVKEGDHWRIAGEFGVTPPLTTVADIAPWVEYLTYRHLARHVPVASVMLHAAAVGDRERLWLLCGPSGSGKSTIAWHAAERGQGYYSDEFVLSDGRHVWGVPRTIQWSPWIRGHARPSWLRGADLETYVMGGRGGEMLAVPLLRPARCARVHRIRRVEIVELRRGRRVHISPLDTAEALAVLHRAAHRGHGEALMGLLAAGRGWRLDWHDPAEAWETLVATVNRAQPGDRSLQSGRHCSRSRARSTRALRSPSR